MTFACSKDATHVSTDPDYCSVCGAKISRAPSLSAPPAATFEVAPLSTVASAEECPVCQTPRLHGARFCEVCRYDFAGLSPAATPAPSIAPFAVQPTPDPAQPAPLLAPVPVTVQPAPMPVQGAGGTLANASERRFEVAIVVDESLYLEPDPNVPAPTERGELVFPLDLDDNLIGRWSAKNPHKPEIPVGDPGASGRHAKISRGDDGVWTLLDVGSTNGTALNGQTIASGARMPLHEGDNITLGCWTRLILRRLR